MYRRQFPNDPGFADSIATARRAAIYNQNRFRWLYVIIGVVLSVASCCLLYFNERSAIEHDTSYQECLSNIRSAPSDGNLVHITGPLYSDKLKDVEFGVSRRSVYLRRIVQVLQYVEESRSSSDEENSHTEYVLKWSTKLISSQRFPSRYKNPLAFPLSGKIYTSSQVRLDQEYELTSSFIKQIKFWTPIIQLDIDKRLLGQGYNQHGHYLYGPGVIIGREHVGDYRISWEAAGIDGTVVSVIGLQNDRRIVPYNTRTGGQIQISLLHLGYVTSNSMIKSAMMMSHLGTWLLRLVGAALFSLAIAINHEWISRHCLSVPRLRTFGHLSLFHLSTLIGFSLSIIVIAAYWIYLRPMIALLLWSLVVFVLLVYGNYDAYLVPRLQRLLRGH